MLRSLIISSAFSLLTYTVEPLGNSAVPLEEIERVRHTVPWVSAIPRAPPGYSWDCRSLPFCVSPGMCWVTKMSLCCPGGLHAAEVSNDASSSNLAQTIKPVCVLSCLCACVLAVPSSQHAFFLQAAFWRPRLDQVPPSSGLIAPQIELHGDHHHITSHLSTPDWALSKSRDLEFCPLPISSVEGRVAEQSAREHGDEGEKFDLKVEGKFLEKGDWTWSGGSREGRAIPWFG